MKMSQNVSHYKYNDFFKIIVLIGQNSVCYQSIKQAYRLDTLQEFFQYS